MSAESGPVRPPAVTPGTVGAHDCEHCEDTGWRWDDRQNCARPCTCDAAPKGFWQ